MNVLEKRILYSLPVKVVASNRNLKEFESLLEIRDDQIGLGDKGLVYLNPGDYFVLDFGEEKCGGIRLLTGFDKTTSLNMKIHIRFGESVSEACSILGENGSCNDHSIRDMVMDIPPLSDQQIGDTGFRFVRIDILKDNQIVHPFKSIYCWEYANNYVPIQQYKSLDKQINEIYKTALHTLNLCMQNRIWDGIKRDRLVWIGDMEPEIHAILHVYGNIELIKKTIDTAVLSNPMPCWINGIPSYSAWFLLIMYDIYSIAGAKSFVKVYQPYMDEIISLFDKSTDTNLDYDKAGLSYAMKYFIDWPSYNDNNENERKEANILLLQYVIPKIQEMYLSLKMENRELTSLVEKVQKIKVSIPATKVFASFYQLVNHDEESYKVLIKDGSKGMSTFMSYYVLKAVALKDKEKATTMLKEYYVAMLNLGATSFFEDFDISWSNSSRIDALNSDNKKDFHREYGDHCYKGYRHSLCHGWSVGPISFLIEEKIK